MSDSSEHLAEQILQGHQLSPSTYVELRASITKALERVAIVAAAGAAEQQMEKDCRANCPMCRIGKDLLLAGDVAPPIERGPLGNWDHPSLSVDGLYASCLASCIRGEWVGRPGRKIA